MIRYAKFAVSLHGMELQSDKELLQLQQRLAEVVREHVHPAGLSNLRFDSDVEVDILESAGLGWKTPGAPELR